MLGDGPYSLHLAFQLIKWEQLQTCELIQSTFSPYNHSPEREANSLRVAQLVSSGVGIKITLVTFFLLLLVLFYGSCGLSPPPGSSKAHLQ